MCVCVCVCDDDDDDDDGNGGVRCWQSPRRSTSSVSAPSTTSARVYRSLQWCGLYQVRDDCLSPCLSSCVYACDVHT